MLTITSGDNETKRQEAIDNAITAKNLAIWAGKQADEADRIYDEVLRRQLNIMEVNQ